MPWIKLIHLASLICWCGALVYILAGVTAAVRTGTSPSHHTPDGPMRTIFTLIATPAALLAIASGTALFLQGDGLSLWLSVKLGAVSVLAVCHVSGGWMIQRAERAEGGAQLGPRIALTASAVAAMAATLWLVLEKPW